MTDWVPRTPEMKGNCACPKCGFVPYGPASRGFGELLYSKGSLVCGNCDREFFMNRKGAEDVLAKGRKMAERLERRENESEKSYLERMLADKVFAGPAKGEVELRLQELADREEE